MEPVNVAPKKRKVKGKGKPKSSSAKKTSTKVKGESPKPSASSSSASPVTTRADIMASFSATYQGVIRSLPVCLWPCGVRHGQHSYTV